MAFNLSEFRGQLVRPARPTLFKVNLDIGNIGSPNFEFQCEASSVPQNQVGVFDIHYQGRKIKYAGDRLFENWTATIISQEGNDLHEQFNQWFELISGFDTGLRDGTYAEATSYKGSGFVTQFTHDGEEIAQYEITCFPSTIGAMDLNWATVDDYITFEVTFSVDWWQRVL